MRRTIAGLCAVVLVMAAMGCVAVKYDKARYISFLQNRNLTITTPDGVVLKYSSNSDPAVQMAGMLKDLALDKSVNSVAPVGP